MHLLFWLFIFRLLRVLVLFRLLISSNTYTWNKGKVKVSALADSFQTLQPGWGAAGYSWGASYTDWCAQERFLSLLARVEALIKQILLGGKTWQQILSDTEHDLTRRREVCRITNTRIPGSSNETAKCSCLFLSQNNSNKSTCKSNH